MKGLNTRIAAIALGTLICGFAAAAQGPGPGAGPGFGAHRPPLERTLGSGPAGRWWNDSAMVEKLNLSEDQRKSMDAILLEHREKLVDMHGTLEKAELGMEPLMGADQPNEQSILSQIDKIAQARAELEKANARFLLAIRAKLTPDQWKQLQASRAERHLLRQNGLGPDGARPHHMHPRGGPDAAAPGGSQGSPPAGPGPQGMIHDGHDSDMLAGSAPAAEAGAIE